MKKRFLCFLRWLLVLSSLALTSSCTNVRFVGPLTITNTFGLMGSGAPSYLNKQIDRIAPTNPRPQDKAIFATYREDATSVWATNWTRSLDFSGVAWDDPRAGTLITRQDIIFASHYQRRVGETVTFHDQNGMPVKRRIIARRIVGRIGTPDIAIGRLDSPVPNTVTHYSLLSPDYDFRYLIGAKVIATDQERLAHLFHLKNLTYATEYEYVRIEPDFPSKVDPAWHERLVVGDSGHPSFIVVEGKLMLLSTHRGGGWGSEGPFFGGPKVQGAIVRAIEQMDRETGSASVASE